MSRTPEHTPAPVTTPELSTEERDIFSLEQLEQWREFQNADLNDRRGHADSIPSLSPPSLLDPEPPYLKEFHDSIDDSLDAYLQSQGVPVDSPNYSEVRSLFRDASIDRIKEREWRISPAARGKDPDDTKSPRDVFGEKIAERLKASSEPEPASDEEAEKEERERRINEARTAVEDAREQWASVSARRQGKVFGRNVGDQAEAYHDYSSKVNQLGRLELEDVINDTDVSDEDKNVAVIAYLFKEQAKLRELTTEKLKNTKVSKFIAWMNKGGIVKRILKGGALGLAAGAAGAFLGGVAGAGILTAGAVAGTRFIRGFALGDKDKRGMATADESINRDEIAHRLDDTDVDGDVFDKASLHLDVAFENDTRKEQNKRRRAAVVGLGMVAVGSAAGYGAHAAAEAFSHHGMQLWHPFDKSGAGHHTTNQGTGNKGGQSGTGSKGGSTGGNKGAGATSGQKPPAGPKVNPPSSIDQAPKLPTVNGEYPWNRMETALQSGIIAPPNGMSAEQALHHYAQMLADNGDNVQWDPLSGGREYLVVNGQDNTNYVWDRIIAAAQKAGDVANR